jgi:hypothetical protein
MEKKDGRDALGLLLAELLRPLRLRYDQLDGRDDLIRGEVADFVVGQQWELAWGASGQRHEHNQSSPKPPGGWHREWTA